MAQYKTVPWDTLEHTELARKVYADYERSLDCPDEAEIEADWITKRKMIRAALEILSPRQREVYILKTGYLMTESKIAERMGLSQATVSQHFQAACKKLQKFIGKTTG